MNTNHPSPNFDSRDGQPVDMLVLHYTGMASAREALERLCDPAAGVSAHYLVEEDGAVHALVPESERAWHAGVSHWRGNSNINQRSIGIEIANPGHDCGYRRFPKPQMEAVARLSKAILARHTIPARNVVAHSDIAPTRKKDPGELFDWEWLAERGIGLWPAASGQRPAVSESKEESLAAYGYDITALPAATAAFQRHFRPKTLTGEWDEECEGLLASLLSMV
ncbi:MAG: N-acetylmuramoyl-L-alanine amidase [Pseudomonadota bacterium]|nr:N-acetylmuramoyl-L-alanine amidase [Pseudomonadota bacterium]MDE3037245.1 N-acetylmuramoyl-L-alanine amidase [Pseudomonadota bacterium]